MGRTPFQEMNNESNPPTLVKDGSAWIIAAQIEIDGLKRERDDLRFQVKMAKGEVSEVIAEIYKAAAEREALKVQLAETRNALERLEAWVTHASAELPEMRNVGTYRTTLQNVERVLHPQIAVTPR